MCDTLSICLSCTSCPLYNVCLTQIACLYPAVFCSVLSWSWRKPRSQLRLWTSSVVSFPLQFQLMSGQFDDNILQPPGFVGLHPHITHHTSHTIVLCWSTRSHKIHAAFASAKLHNFCFLMWMVYTCRNQAWLVFGLQHYHLLSTIQQIKWWIGCITHVFFVALLWNVHYRNEPFSNLM